MMLLILVLSLQRGLPITSCLTLQPTEQLRCTSTGLWSRQPLHLPTLPTSFPTLGLRFRRVEPQGQRLFPYAARLLVATSHNLSLHSPIQGPRYLPSRAGPRLQTPD